MPQKEMPSRQKKNDPATDAEGGKKGKMASKAEKIKLPCPHSFCNEPSDPSYYPKGLPWASGKLKCLPGYCPKSNKIPGTEEEGEEDQKKGDGQEEGVFDVFLREHKKKVKPKCQCDHCKTDRKKIKEKKKKRKREKESSLFLKKMLCRDDPEVNEELMFFLKVIIMANDMDELEEELRKRKQEERKKRAESRKKKQAEKKNAENSEKNPDESKKKDEPPSNTDVSQA
ncbi:glutamic acid-rich protein-like isoform X2 [Cimex lectularius]|uniref:Uncharacterized protein n=1 Tax=Cimex lectularius TaxID=79782 RepID=A0A8I6TGF7_CIMLE|nr:glutamic acid-rich protein-like isoform X2 [Cimex lectularius]